MIVQGGIRLDIDIVGSGRKERDGVSSRNDTDCGNLKDEGDERQNRKCSQIHKKVKQVGQTGTKRDSVMRKRQEIIRMIGWRRENKEGKR